MRSHHTTTTPAAETAPPGATPSERSLGRDVVVLEREVVRLREQTVLTSSDAAAARVDAAAARALAAGADRDVSEVRAELRAHIQALNALRETQLEQAREIAEMRAEMREGFAEMREGFAKQATGMAQITALLTMIAGPEDPS
jgi:hypothetical protein